AGSARDVDHNRSRGQPERGDGLAPPTHVHPERHDPVHEVVAGGDGIEHRPDLPDLVVTPRQRILSGSLAGRHVDVDRIVIPRWLTNAPTSTSAVCPSASTGPSGCSPCCSGSRGGRDGYWWPGWRSSSFPSSSTSSGTRSRCAPSSSAPM